MTGRAANEPAGAADIEDRLRRAEASLDPAGREVARELVGALLEYHRAGIERLLALMAGSGGAELLDRSLESDDLVRSMLLLHDLHPWPLEVRVARAVDRLRTELDGSGRARIEVVLVSPARIAIRVASDAHLEARVEQAVRDAAPEVEAIEVERATVDRDLVPASRLRRDDRCARCALCGGTLAEIHSHLLERETRQLACACEPCSVLFPDGAGRYQRIRRRAARLDIDIDDPTWVALGVPVGLAYFTRVSRAGAIIAGYPGPAGATESVVDERAWRSLLAASPALAAIEPDVEALLVDRRAGTPRHYRVSIDECYRLSGLVRAGWRGLRGGDDVNRAVEAFFSALGEEPPP